MLVGALTGCDAVLGIERYEAGPDASTVAYDRCAPGVLADDPLRFAYVPTQLVASTSWQDARTYCQRIGMDLQVFHDAHEMGTALTAQWPFWFGTSQDTAGAWQNIDGCPVFGMPTPPVLAHAAPSCAAMFDALAPGGTSCDGTLAATPVSPDHVLGLACATPRPETAACLPKDPTTETYTVGPALAYADARAYCQGLGQHLVQIDSFAELGVVSGLVHGQSIGDFWMGATFDGQAWQSATGCPAEFSWANGLPAAEGSCLGGVTAISDDGVTWRGMDLDVCTHTKLAVCEPY